MNVLAPTPGTLAGFQLEAVFQFPELPEAQMDCASVFSRATKPKRIARKNVPRAVRRRVISGIQSYRLPQCRPGWRACGHSIVVRKQVGRRVAFWRRNAIGCLSEAG